MGETLPPNKYDVFCYALARPYANELAAIFLPRWFEDAS
jgi:hypothetical protein